MRIAYLCTDFGIPISGTKGAAIHVREMCRAWLEEGHVVQLYSPRPGADRRQEGGLPVMGCEPTREERRIHDALRNDPAVESAMASACRSLQYTATLPRRLEAALRVFGPDLLYERYSLFGVAGLHLARRLGVPHVLEVNAPLAEEQRRYRGLDATWSSAAAAIEGEVLRGADHVLAVSRTLADWIEAQGVSPSRVSVQPNAVDPERFTPLPGAREAMRLRLGLGEAPVIGFVGSLKPWHDVATLLRAVAVLGEGAGGAATPVKDARLLVVGEGPGRPQLQALAEALGLAGRVHFTGAVPHSQVPELLAAMDVAVAPYPAAELQDASGSGLPADYFSPLKLFEYLAAGVPVVATNCAPCRQVIEEGRSGWLARAGDPADLARVLAGVLADPALALIVAQRGRRRVIRRHTWRANARRAVSLAEAYGATGAAQARSLRQVALTGGI